MTEQRRKLEVIKGIVDKALETRYSYDETFGEIRDILDGKVMVNSHDNIDLMVNVYAHVRYWEDARINGTPDDADAPEMPCIDGELWCPVINVDTGQILEWPQDTIARIHYKVCDECGIKITENGVVIYEDEDYVPDFLCPLEEGFGDYIIMDIDGNGFIKGWNENQVHSFLETNL